MILTTHILLAITSTLYSPFVILSPTKYRLYTIYSLTLGTLISGITLVLLTPSYLGQTCLSGSLYLGFMVVINKLARKKLAVVNQRTI